MSFPIRATSLRSQFSVIVMASLFVRLTASAEQMPIPQTKCNEMLSRTAADLRLLGRGFISDVTLSSLKSFFGMRTDKVALCNGVRFLEWSTNDNDLPFVMAVSTGLHFSTIKKLIKLGFKDISDIKDFVHTGKKLGVDDIDAISISLAQMKSDDPKNYQSHVSFFQKEFGPGLIDKHILDRKVLISEIDHKIARERNGERLAKLKAEKDKILREIEGEIAEKSRLVRGVVNDDDYGISPAVKPRL